MFIEKVSLFNFKNYGETEISFGPHINVLVGKNGSGKTNLLDAIYFLSLTKSAFASADSYCIRQGEPVFMIRGHFVRDGKKFEVVSSVQQGSKKILRENQVEYSRVSDHIGKYPVVLIAPDDVQLVREGSEYRRKFFDGIIAQVNRDYLEALIRYNQALRLRNAMLKLFADTGKQDLVALEGYDDILCRDGFYIYQQRQAFIVQFQPVFQRFYSFLVEANESTGLTYLSGLNDTGFRDGLVRCRNRDLHSERTNFGVHRDDFVFSLGNGDLKRLGSQGQQKSFVIALKFSQYELVEKLKGFKPIMLLDDIFDKLDDSRIAKLLEMIGMMGGQTFITDARPDRTVQYIQQAKMTARVYSVNNGQVSVREEESDEEKK